MARGSGTRSGLLWEVERILDECKELPQVLLMENVPDVIGSKNFKHFSEWVNHLDTLGYKSYYKVLNSKEVGYPEPIPQNRERCFMVSILGDYFYEFPRPTELKTRLKDVLEKNVDEKYYLSDSMVQYYIKHTKECEENGKGFRFKPTDGNAIGRSITTRAGGRMDDNFVIQEAQIYPNSGNPQAGRIYSADGLSPTLDTCEGGNRMPKIIEAHCIGGIGEKKSNGGAQYYQQDRVYEGDIALAHPANLPSGSYMYKAESRIRKLTPRECFRLMGVKDEDFDKIAKNQSDSSLYHLAGDSIVTNVLQAIFKNMT